MPKGSGSWVWTGSISFGLVNVPVGLVPATRPLDFRFRELHRPDTSPVERRRFCLEEEVEVPLDEVARGYEIREGQMVVLTDEELASVAPERTQTIEIESFTDPDEIDPILFGRSYYAVPAGKGEGAKRAYGLLVEAMQADGRAAIGRFVMRTREYLVVLRARESVLCLTTLLYSGEVRPTEEVPVGEAEAPERTVEEAVAVIEELTTEWRPDSYEDCYRARLAEVIEDKKRGRQIASPSADEDSAERETTAPDLMEALKRTLQEARGDESGRSRGRRRRKRQDADSPSREDLYRRAQEAGLEGRSKMTKDELSDALDEP